MKLLRELKDVIVYTPLLAVLIVMLIWSEVIG
jgi:hypothetical protein